MTTDQCFRFPHREQSTVPSWHYRRHFCPSRVFPIHMHTIHVWASARDVSPSQAIVSAVRVRFRDPRGMSHSSNVYVLRGSSFFSLCLSHTSKFFVTSRIPLDLPNTHQRTPSQRRVGATQDRTKLRTYLGDNELHDAEAFYCDVRNPFWLPKHKRVGHADHRPSHVHAVPQLKPMRIVSAFRFRGWEIKNG